MLISFLIQMIESTIVPTPIDMTAGATTNAVAAAAVRPEHLIVILGALLISGCIFIALEVRAEYKDDS